LVAGNALCGNPLSIEQLLILATQLEGHPDNVAPALLGGLVIVVWEEGRLVHSKVSVPNDLEAALFVPDFLMPTEEARRVLPHQVPHSDAVYNSGRVALLICAFAQGRYDLLDIATRDRLHQPYREAIFPAMPRLFAVAREAGALGVFLSGAGSAVLALCRENARVVAEAMAETARGLTLTGRALVAPVVSQGAEATLIHPPRPVRPRKGVIDHW
jgi:homoserine kinase